jgi:molybdopterin-binding protein
MLDGVFEGIMKAGARNQIIGTVKEIKRGTIMSLVKLDIPAKSEMSSVMTVDSLDDLGLKKGDKVRVLVKAVHILLIRE